MKTVISMLTIISLFLFSCEKSEKEKLPPINGYINFTVGIQSEYLTSFDTVYADLSHQFQLIGKNEYGEFIIALPAADLDNPDGEYSNVFFEYKPLDGSELTFEFYTHGDDQHFTVIATENYVSGGFLLNIMGSNSEGGNQIVQQIAGTYKVNRIDYYE